MLLIIAVLLLALILFGVGFAVHVLWWIALIVLALWLLGFLFRAAGGTGPPGNMRRCAPPRPGRHRRARRDDSRRDSGGPRSGAQPTRPPHKRSGA